MKVFINHCWCSDCNWGGVYHCRVIVSINRIPSGGTYYSPPTSDWINLVEEVRWPDNRLDTVRLKQEVIEWLEENIKDRKDKTHPKGWSVGTDTYNSRDGLQFNVFFESVKQALKFVKKWSVRQKPTCYFNYFNDIKMEFNPKTKQLNKVKQFSQ